MNGEGLKNKDTDLALSNCTHLNSCKTNKNSSAKYNQAGYPLSVSTLWAENRMMRGANKVERPIQLEVRWNKGRGKQKLKNTEIKVKKNKTKKTDL